MRKTGIFMLGALSFVLISSSCGYQGYYRYSCQDPSNWENEECQRPLCEIGTGCSDELVGRETE